MRTMQPIYRILHTPSFWEDYETFWSDAGQNNTSVSFLVLLCLVIAIGSTFYRGEDAVECRRKAVHFNQLAQSWISGPSETTTQNITGLQTFCLLLLSKQTTLHCPGPAWLSAGSLLSMAMAMGLHRDPANFSSLPPYECEMRRRLWAAVMELAMQWHIDAPAPLLVSSADFDTAPPLSINDHDIGLGKVEYPTAQSGMTDSSLQIELFRSLKLRLEATQVLTGLNAHHTFERAVELGDKIRSVGSHICTFLREAIRTSSKVSDFHYHFVEILHHRYIMLLHQPFMIQARTNPSFYLSRKTCFGSANTIASYASEMTKSRSQNKYADLFQLSAVGRASFKGPLGLHAILVLGLELTMVLKEGQAANTHLDQMDQTRKMSCDRIISRLNDINAQLLDTLRFGSVNMKAVNFLSAFLAQISAMENGRSVKLEVYEAFRSCLKTCRAILDETSEHSTDTGPMQTSVDHVSANEVPPINFDALVSSLPWFTMPHR